MYLSWLNDQFDVFQRNNMWIANKNYFSNSLRSKMCSLIRNFNSQWKFTLIIHCVRLCAAGRIVSGHVYLCACVLEAMNHVMIQTQNDRLIILCCMLLSSEVVSVKPLPSLLSHASLLNFVGYLYRLAIQWKLAYQWPIYRLIWLSITPVNTCDHMM